MPNPIQHALVPAHPPAKKPALDTPANVTDLATVIMSEAGIYNSSAQTAVGFTVFNRMIRDKAASVSRVWGGYAHNQAPTPMIRTLAKNILSGKVVDPTKGATHFFSPQLMPRKGQPTTGIDVAGGLEQVAGLPYETYQPGWATRFVHVIVPGVLSSQFQFYREPGNGPVR